MRIVKTKTLYVKIYETHQKQCSEENITVNTHVKKKLCQFNNLTLYLNEKQTKTVCVLCHCSHVWLFATQWTIVLQAPLSIRFYRQDYWSGLPCPAPEDLPDPGTNLHLSCRLHWLVDSSATWEAQIKPEGSKSYEIIKIKGKINKSRERIYKAKIWFF